MVGAGVTVGTKDNSDNEVGLADMDGELEMFVVGEYVISDTPP